MQAAKNMDSVFDGCTDSELDFDIIFDEDDTLIEAVMGFNEDGSSMIGGDPEDEYQVDGDASKKGPSGEGTAKNQLVPNEFQKNGEALKTQEPGAGTSAESHAHEAPKLAEEAARNLIDNLLESSDEGPLEDDDLAERTGKTDNMGGSLGDGFSDKIVAGKNDEGCQTESLEYDLRADLLEEGDDVNDLIDSIFFSEADIPAQNSSSNSGTNTQQQSSTSTGSNVQQNNTSTPASSSSNTSTSQPSSNSSLNNPSADKSEEGKPNESTDAPEDVKEGYTYADLLASMVNEAQDVPADNTEYGPVVQESDEFIGNLIDDILEDAKYDVTFQAGAKEMGSPKNGTSEIDDDCDCGQRHGEGGERGSDREGVSQRPLQAGLESSIIDNIVEAVCDEILDESDGSDDIEDYVKKHIEDLTGKSIYPVRIREESEIYDPAAEDERAGRAGEKGSDMEGVKQYTIRGGHAEDDLDKIIKNFTATNNGETMQESGEDFIGDLLDDVLYEASKAANADPKDVVADEDPVDDDLVDKVENEKDPKRKKDAYYDLPDGDGDLIDAVLNGNY